MFLRRIAIVIELAMDPNWFKCWAGYRNVWERSVKLAGASRLLHLGFQRYALIEFEQPPNQAAIRAGLRPVAPEHRFDRVGDS